MKISALLLFVAILHVSAKTLAQKVTLTVKNAPITTVFEQISDQTGYDFAFSTSAIKGAKPITLNVKEVELADVLKEIFTDQPLDYSVEEKSVIVSVKQAITTAKPQNKLIQDKIEVKGMVTDEKGLPLSGVTVAIKNTKIVATTDTKGLFDLKNVDPKSTLVLSYIGYTKIELPAVADIGTIKLKVAENQLDAVQVIAYGETTQRLSVGDVSTIDAKTISQQPVTDVLLALEDRVPGLLIKQGSGMPGAGVYVSIRGTQSLNNGNAPFYVIDGVPYVSQDYFSTQTGGVDPLSFINPSDVENISVLKDADATAIYGSRAANGAILITTKKGKAGKTRFELNYSQGVEYAPQQVQWMNTKQYLQMRREALANDGVAPDINTAPDLVSWDTTRNTNWEKIFTGNAAQYKKIQTSISGGNANTQFLFSGGWQEQSTVFPFSESVPQGDVHLNVTNSSLDNRFKISVTASYSTNTSHLPQVDLTQFTNLPPDYPSLYKKDGTLDLVGTDFYPGGGVLGGNPLAFELQQTNESTDNLISNANVSYKLIKNLTLSSNFGYTKSQSTDNKVTPIASLDPSIPETGQSNFNTTNTTSWIIEPQLNYSKEGKWGKIDFLLGSQFEENTISAQSLLASGYTTDALINDIAAAPAVMVYGGSGGVYDSEYKYNALFSRLNYNYQDEYIADFTWRRDGSSRFGADNAIHDFGSIGGAWIFTKEKMFTNNLSWLSFGKIRGSYGTTGNDQIGDYKYDNLYNLTGNFYQNGLEIIPYGLPNATLEWESTRKLEIGVELGFIKDRILLTASWYTDRSSNQLLSEGLPSITGFSSVTTNLPAIVQNTGWEFTLHTVNIQTSTFSWKTNFNVSANQNKLISFPGLASSPYAGQFFVGKPVGTNQLFQYVDVNQQTGVYEFRAANGQLTSNPDYTTDRTAFSPNTFPKFYGGLGNTLSYGSLELSVFFQFRKQTGVNPLLQNIPPGLIGNEPTLFLNAWQKPGDVTTIEKYTESPSSPAYIAYGDAQQSTHFYVDASFIRLSNLSLSYQVKSNWVERLRLQNLKVFLQAQNLLTITGYKGADPATQNWTALPPLRIIDAGVSISL